MVIAAELASPLRRLPAPSDAAILSYDGGLGDPPMEVRAPAQAPEDFR